MISEVPINTQIRQYLETVRGQEYEKVIDLVAQKFKMSKTLAEHHMWAAMVDK